MGTQHPAPAVRHDEEQHRFVLYSASDAQMGELDYRIGENRQLYATHTGVRSQYGGRGYAALLVDALAQYALAENYTILPLCSYVARRFDQHPETYKTVDGRP